MNLLVSFLLGPLFGVSLAQEEPEQTHLITLAKAFVEHLSKGEFAIATKNYDTAMQKALPTDKLEETWKSLIAQVGAFKRQTGVRTEHVAKYAIVFVTCEFEKASLDARVVFNTDKQISGLFFSPSNKAEKYQAPDYVKQSSLKESNVTIGSGEWQLPGTLTLPLGQGPFRAVVFVHGSGPQDRDETIGPNRPFRDLAWGLASQGIAVLRYEKRTKKHAAKFAEAVDQLTIKEEVIDDALAAVALLRKTDRVDAKKIFVLGHSLGAMCAPRIAALDPEIRGIVLLAGNTRPLEDLMIEQLDYILSLDKNLPDEKKKELEKIKEQAVTVKHLKPSDNVPKSKLPFGVPAAYWLCLREYHPVNEAAQIRQPMLILQGERDYQVTMEDFEGWRKGLASRRDIILKSYPKLNHLFMSGEGKAKPAEYETTGHVDQEVIKDIAAWIKLQ